MTRRLLRSLLEERLGERIVRTSGPRAHLVAVFTIALLTTLKWALQGLGEGDADVAYLAGVMFSGWLGGFGPAMTATLLSVLATTLLFSSPRFADGHGTSEHAVVAAGMLVEGTVIAILCGAMRRAQRRAVDAARRARLRGERLQQTRDELQAARAGLEEQVVTRTAELSRANDELRRMMIEQQQAAERLREAQKMEALGRLAGGVAHDFNNLLAVINSYSEMLMEDLGEDPSKDIAEILDAGRRAASLTGQLLAFSRKQVLRMRPIDLGVAVSSMETLLRRLITENVHLTIRLPTEVATIVADPTQMEQVLVNLVVNARDAMGEGGTISIELDRVLLDDPAVHGFCELPSGVYAVLRVIDTGVGMDPATQKRIFEPFFTTKSQAGTGLGLATVLGIAQQCAGAIRVESAVGKGTTFHIAFPTADCAPDAVKPMEQGTAKGANEVVLLVEDEDAVRRTAAAILSRNGYRVLEASNAGEALLICEHQAQVIDVVLTDVVMPHMSGPKLAQRIHAHRPGTPVLFMSGYPDDDGFRLTANDSPLLQKPFTARSLTHAIRDALDISHAERRDEWAHPISIAG